jgi:hypothetical protein
VPDPRSAVPLATEKGLIPRWKTVVSAVRETGVSPVAFRLSVDAPPVYFENDFQLDRSLATPFCKGTCAKRIEKAAKILSETDRGENRRRAVRGKRN